SGPAGRRDRTIVAGPPAIATVNRQRPPVLCPPGGCLRPRLFICAPLTCPPARRPVWRLIPAKLRRRVDRLATAAAQTALSVQWERPLWSRLGSVAARGCKPQCTSDRAAQFAKRSPA